MEPLFTNIEVTLLKNPKGKMRAYGKLTVASALEVRFTVWEGTKGLFARLPTKQGTKLGDDGKIPWFPEVKILDDEAYSTFQKLVMAEYNKIAGNQVSAGESNQTEEYTDGIPF